MHAKWLFFFLIFTACLFCCVSKKYYNYSLFTSTPQNKIHMDYLKQMSAHFEVDFWIPPRMSKPVDFVMGPERREVFMSEARSIGLNFNLVIGDLQRIFDTQEAKPYRRSKPNSFDGNNYYRLSGIYQWLEDLTDLNSREMQIIKIGQTHEERNILAVRIALNGSKIRSKVMLEGGIHAREWISTAVVTCLIDQILHAGKSDNKNLQKIARNYEWYFVPVLNPDGYEYTHTNDRLWRKNRNGEGVDLNRNFGHKFGGEGASQEPSSEDYCGPEAFSEQESQAMANFIRQNGEDLEYYFAFHSYSQLMLIPYASSKEHEENYEEMKSMCNNAAQQIRKRYGTAYSTGTVFESIGYLASGASTCWVKQEFLTPYVVTFELRDTGTYGFALPPDQIMPTCLETIDGLTSLLEPQTRTFEHLRERKYRKYTHNHQVLIILDRIVIFFCIIIFFVRFYFCVFMLSTILLALYSC